MPALPYPCRGQWAKDKRSCVGGVLGKPAMIDTTGAEATSKKVFKLFFLPLPLLLRLSSALLPAPQPSLLLHAGADTGWEDGAGRRMGKQLSLCFCSSQDSFGSTSPAAPCDVICTRSAINKENP